MTECIERNNFFTYMLTVMLVCMGLSATTQAAEMYSEQVLFTEPSVTAERVGIARLGEVAILGQREGFWVRIQTADQLEGWVKVSHVKVEETEVWMDPIDSLRDTGRLAISKKRQETRE